MSSYNQASQEGGVQEGQIVKSGRHVKVVHEVISSKDYVLHGAVTMVVDLSKFGTISGKKYEEPLGDPVSVCGSEKALSAGKLINFGDAIGLVLDCIEQLSTHKLVHSRVVSLYLNTKFLRVLVTSQGVPAWAQLT